jgi:pyruvate dehydrogenase complex dehydrogenase (E1) component
MLHPTEPPRVSYVEKLLAKEQGPFIAASDYMKSMPEMIGRWIPGGLYSLGTDGFGASPWPLCRNSPNAAKSNGNAFNKRFRS